jgi:hypothetical protein
LFYGNKTQGILLVSVKTLQNKENSHDSLPDHGLWNTTQGISPRPGKENAN